MNPYYQTIRVTDDTRASDLYDWDTQQMRIRDLKLANEAREQSNRSAWQWRADAEEAQRQCKCLRKEVDRLQNELRASQARELGLRAEVIAVDLLGLGVRDARWHSRNVERLALIKQAGEVSL